MVQGQHYSVLRKIGEGAFSQVFMCRPSGNGARQFPVDVVAIKRATVGANTVHATYEEIAIIEAIGDHPAIVKHYGMEVGRVMGQYHAMYVMEHCSATVIGEMLEAQKRRMKFRADKVVHIFASMCSAIQHLHSRSPPISHRDLKPENIFRTDDGRYVLGDFGSCTTVAYRCLNRKDASKATDEIERNTTLEYRAPEMVEPWTKQRIDQKTDVWSLGVLLYYLMYFKLPFDTALAISNHKLVFPVEDVWPQCLKDIVVMCLNPNPKERPTIFDICSVVCGTPDFGIEPDLLTAMPDPNNEQALAIGDAEPTEGATPAGGSDTGLFAKLQWSDGGGQQPPQQQPKPSEPPIKSKRESDLFMAKPASPPPQPAQQQKAGGGLDFLFDYQSSGAKPNFSPSTTSPASSQASPSFIPNFAPTAKSSGQAPSASGTVDLFAAWDGPQDNSSTTPPQQSPTRGSPTPPAAQPSTQRNNSDFLFFGGTSSASQQPQGTPPGGSPASRQPQQSGGGLDDILSGFTQSKMVGKR